MHEVFHEKGAAPAGTEAVDHAAGKWKRRKQQIAAMRRWLPKQERDMGLIDILNGMQNGPRGPSQSRGVAVAVAVVKEAGCRQL